jgi:hypothetical protein
VELKQVALCAAGPPESYLGFLAIKLNAVNPILEIIKPIFGQV